MNIVAPAGNYEKLEAQLLGWDTSDDAYEIDI